MRQSVMTRVREHPLGFLYLLLALTAEAVAAWLLFTSLGSSGIDDHRAAVGKSACLIGLVFVLAISWNTPSPSLLDSTGAENTAATPDRSRGMRLYAWVQGVALTVWAVMLVLALAELVAALAGNRGIALTLGTVVGWLLRIGVVGMLVVRVSAVGRQR